jgi:hypothetical protein
MSSDKARYRLVAASLTLALALSSVVSAQVNAPRDAQTPTPAQQQGPTQTAPAQPATVEPAPAHKPAEAQRTTDKAMAADTEKAEQGKKDDKKDALPQGTAVFWRDPGDISARDLKAGPGSNGPAPDLSRLTFVEEEQGGYSVKYRVRDAAGRVWVAKLGKEAQPETAATRIVWAVGYPTEVTYLAPCVRIEGAPAPRKEVERCEGNGFANVRFEARPDNVKRLTEWKWGQNPFHGQREMNGFIVLMALLNNWDLKDSNNKIIYYPEQGELHYIVSDLGATFGKTGNFITHNRNEPDDYAKSKFIKKIEGGRVEFAYAGKNTGLLANIPVEDARWIGSLLAQLTDRQLKDAFLAANYDDATADQLAASVRAKISELTALGAEGVPARAAQ